VSWEDQAACKGTPIDWWFPRAVGSTDADPEYDASAIPPQALKRCERCTVFVQCAATAARYGVWAATSQSGREAMRRSRSRTAQAEAQGALQLFG